MQPVTKNTGFTLIEMLVSLSLFTIVITITLGSFLVLISGNQGFIARQSVMDTLAFSLDSMTREIRTGSFYVCAGANSLNAPFSPSSFVPEVTPPPRIFQNGHESLSTSTRNCPDGNTPSRTFHGISFVEGGDSITGVSDTRIMYYYDSSVGVKTIMRKIGDTSPPERIIPDNIIIENAEFFVTGTERLTSGDIEQPVVTLVIEAREANADISETVTLQSTVTQRSLDL